MKYSICLIFLFAGLAANAAPEKILYQNNFEKSDLDQAPNDFLVLNGDFAVKQGDGNKYLELPGSPLDTFGALFGPTTNAGVTVAARIYGTRKGRREPVFGVGLNGAGGYKLEISPAKNMLEIFKGDTSVMNVPFFWQSGTWTEFRLRLVKADLQWSVEGKAWPQSSPEPGWMIRFEEKTAPHDGRPSIWGNPFSGTPIRFDDIVVATPGN